MFLEKIKSEGIAHLSYMLGSGDQAVVIDSRRDIDVYLDIARKQSVNITHIFETHRNEDYVIGSVLLAERTGSDILHGMGLEFCYGKTVSQGDSFEVNGLRLEILDTPGHTFESISIAIFDRDYGNKAVGVFTGDALFVGDVGRTDFFPDQAEKVAGMLYDSIFEKLLPLGDQTILYPAHGAGSVCGSGMASREFSTLGHERMFNPVLQKSRDEFIQYKTSEKHNTPPYFKIMERYNQQGPPSEYLADILPVLSPDEFQNMQAKGMQVIDTRSPEAFAGCFIPSSLAIPLNMVPAFAGWFVSYDRPIGLILNSSDQIKEALSHLYRIGFDNIAGFLAGELHSWAISGKEFESIPVIHVSELLEKINNNEDFTLLDVRSEEEYESGRLPGSINIYLGHLPSKLAEIPVNSSIVTFCASGRRATIAASILKNSGFENVHICMGSMEACYSLGYGDKIKKVGV